MKKILSLALVFAASISANAQEVCQIDAAGAGITSTAATIAAGTVVGTSDNVSISILNEDKVKAASCKMKNSGFLIGDATLAADGVTGSTNPTNASGNPALNLADGIPTTGFALQFDVKADGYLYVCGKLSSNKNYCVFEEGRAIGFDLAMWCDAATQFQPLSITVENDATDETGLAYRTTSIAWPEVIFTGDETSAVKKNGEGVIKFPVYAGCKYVVGAGGSKISCCGAVFSTDGNLTVTLPETTTTDETAGTTTTEIAHVLMGGTTGINVINAATTSDVNAPAYNIAGQRVSKDAKGLIICNHKKYVNR